MNKKSKVILLPCNSYREASVYEALKKGMKLLDIREILPDKNEKILLKPNLLKKADPDRAVITHPAVVGMFARILREEGYGNMIAGDSCGTGNTSKVIAGTGMDAYLERYGVPAVDFSAGVKVRYPEGVQAKEFILAREAAESSCVISVCKMKTHALERITGAVKNSYGFVYGFHKAKGHTQYPSADSFARMLVDLNRLVNPRLYIMDGITAMEGNGPTSGDPIPMNVLMFSEDPVALDTVFCHLVYLDPELVPTNVHGEKMGLGTWKSSQIDVVTPEGTFTPEQIGERYGNREFHVDRKKVKGKTIMDTFRVFGIFRKKPYIVKDQCRKCGICVSACPVEGKAIRFKNGRTNPPVYDYKKCIRCFCCQEMCPHRAIKVK